MTDPELTPKQQAVLDRIFELGVAAGEAKGPLTPEQKAQVTTLIWPHGVPAPKRTATG